GLLSYIEALGSQANDNLPSAPRHAPMLAQTSTPAPDSTSLDEAHRAENRWPVIDADDSRARRQNILDNSPALFPIEEHAKANSAAPSHRRPNLGAHPFGNMIRRSKRKLRAPVSIQICCVP